MKKYLMKTERKILLSSYFLKFIIASLFITGVGLIFIYFHSLIYPEKYTSLIITKNNSLIFNLDIKNVPKTYEGWKNTKQVLHFNLLDNFSKVRFLLSKFTNVVGYFFITLLFNRFLKNTLSIKFFFESNIKILNKILYILVGLFLLKLLPINLYTMVFFENGVPHHVSKSFMNLNFLFYYPLLIIFIYLLKIVFKQGQELKIENDLTI
jgi:hypothetical protein